MAEKKQVGDMLPFRIYMMLLGDILNINGLRRNFLSLYKFFIFGYFVNSLSF